MMIKKILAAFAIYSFTVVSCLADDQAMVINVTGKVMFCESKEGENCRQIKTGDKVSQDGFIQLEKGGVITLLGSDGNTRAIDEPGTFRIASVMHSPKEQSSGFMKDFFHWVAESLFHHEENVNKQFEVHMEQTAVVIRASRSQCIKPFLPPSTRVLGNPVEIQWVTQTDKAPFTIEFSPTPEFNNVALFKQSTSSEKVLIRKDLRKVGPGKVYWHVKSATDDKCSSEVYQINLLTKKERKTIKRGIKLIKKQSKNLSPETTKYFLAKYYEREELYGLMLREYIALARQGDDFYENSLKDYLLNELGFTEKELAIAFPELFGSPDN